MFDACWVINLDRRPDRWQRFLAEVRRVDWPFPLPERVAAIDGAACTPPPGFGGTAGAFGCLQSHLHLMQRAAAEGIDSVVIFEDDAVVGVDRFGDRVAEFLDYVPHDWEQLYFGGRHCMWHMTPTPVNANVLRGRCVLGTWAYAIRGFAKHALHYALARWPNCLADPLFNVDRIFGQQHRLGMVRAYTPWQWFLHHGGGRSDINGHTHRTNDFDLPRCARRLLRRHLAEKEVSGCR